MLCHHWWLRPWCDHCLHLAHMPRRTDPGPNLAPGLVSWLELVLPGTNTNRQTMMRHTTSSKVCQCSSVLQFKANFKTHLLKCHYLEFRYIHYVDCSLVHALQQHSTPEQYLDGVLNKWLLSLFMPFIDSGTVGCWQLGRGGQGECGVAGFSRLPVCHPHLPTTDSGVDATNESTPDLTGWPCGIPLSFWWEIFFSSFESLPKSLLILTFRFMCEASGLGI